MDYESQHSESSKALNEKHLAIISPLSWLYNTGPRDRFWSQVAQYGLTKEGFASRHPELVQREEEVDARSRNIQKLTFVSIAAGALAALIPIIGFGKKWFPNRIAQWAVGLVSGVITGILGGALVSRTFHDYDNDSRAAIMSELTLAMGDDLAVAIERTESAKMAAKPSADGFVAAIETERCTSQHAAVSATR